MFFKDKNQKQKLLTSNDIIYSLKRSLSPQNNSQAYNHMKHKILGLENWYQKQRKLKKTDYNIEIEGLRKIDKYTIEIKVSSSKIDLVPILSLSYFSIVPKEAVNYYKKDFYDNPVGTGPYISDKKNKISSTYTYFKNDNYTTINLKKYAQNKINISKSYSLIKKIVVKEVTSDKEKINLFLFGKIDILPIDNLFLKKSIFDDKITLKKIKSNNINIISSKSLIYTSLGFNLNKFPFKESIDIRKAISLAIDTNKLNDLFSPFYKQTESLIPFELFKVSSEYMNPYYTYDLEHANQIMSDKKINTNFIITLDIIDTYTYAIYAKLIKLCLEKLGLRIKIIKNSKSRFEKKLKTGNFVMFLNNYKYDNDLAIFLGKYTTNKNGNGSRNIFNYSNKKYDELYKNLTDDIMDKKDIYIELNQYLSEDLPEISLNIQKKISLVQPWISAFLNPFTESTCQYFLIDTTKKYDILSKKKLKIYSADSTSLKTGSI